LSKKIINYSAAAVGKSKGKMTSYLSAILKYVYCPRVEKVKNMHFV